MTTRRFRIAFSFAGEKRDYVGQIASVLAEKLGKAHILYDKFHEAEFARRDLGIYLPALYHDESDLVVVVLCADYEGKEWCGLEWTAIHALLKNRRDDEVMLCRFDHATIRGLYDTAGFVELDRKTPDEVVTLILQRFESIKPSPNKRKRRAYSLPAVNSLAIPNNLPRMNSFFGRESELKLLADALSPKTRTWGALIEGPGGMGKTSLAIRAAELVPQSLFKRIVFLSSKERNITSDGVGTLSDFFVPGYSEVLSELARVLKRPELTRQSTSERARQLTEALETASFLLICDNVEALPDGQQQQLFEFLGHLPQGCKALVTSRRDTDVDARIIRLGRLNQSAALDLLSDLSGDRPLLNKVTDAQRLHLYEETGGNPLLLRWIAAQLGKGKCQTAESAIEFLRLAPPGNDPLEFIFGDLLASSTESEVSVLASLSHFSSPMKYAVVARVSGLTQTAAQTAIGDLARKSLVVDDGTDKNFSLVPMVGDFVRRTCAQKVQESAIRLVDHAFALVLENGSEATDRFPNLDADWPIVAAAIPLFIEGPLIPSRI